MSSGRGQKKLIEGAIKGNRIDRINYRRPQHILSLRPFCNGICVKRGGNRADSRARHGWSSAHTTKDAKAYIHTVGAKKIGMWPKRLDFRLLLGVIKLSGRIKGSLDATYVV